jgi:hypothetical protein
MRAPARAEPKPKAVPPCFRYDYDPVFIPACVQAMYEGTATAHQQRALLDWIVGEAAATYQPAHVPGDSHSSAFLAGRAFVGHALRKMIVLKPGAFQTAPINKETTK